MSKNNCPISFTSYEVIDENSISNNHIINSVNSLNLSQYLKNTIIGFSTSILYSWILGEEKKPDFIIEMVDKK
jgi:hypothetical protein